MSAKPNNETYHHQGLPDEGAAVFHDWLAKEDRVDY